MDKNSLLNPRDVVALPDSVKSPVSGRTFKIAQLLQALAVGVTLGNAWTEDGVPCEILKANIPGWQTGKILVSVQFIPDEPEVSASEVNDMDALRSKLDL